MTAVADGRCSITLQMALATLQTGYRGPGLPWKVAVQLLHEANSLQNKLLLTLCQ